MNLIFCKNQAKQPLFEINSTDDRKSTIKNQFLLNNICESGINKRAREK